MGLQDWVYAIVLQLGQVDCSGIYICSAFQGVLTSALLSSTIYTSFDAFTLFYEPDKTALRQGLESNDPEAIAVAYWKERNTHLRIR